MIRITEFYKGKENGAAILTLPFETRQKSRFRARLDGGEDAALVLERGTVLRPGDRLKTEDGLIIEIRAAKEELSKASTDDPHLLARACYHLGNRHVALQIGDTWVTYQRDHVLDDMVRQLGLEVSLEKAVFEPEAGAYQNSHNQSEGHGHT